MPYKTPVVGGGGHVPFYVNAVPLMYVKMFNFGPVGHSLWSCPRDWSQRLRNTGLENSDDLNTELVRYSNGPKLFSCQMVQISNVI